MPWIVRHSAYIMNRYAVHSNGCTSYFNRWTREQNTPLCEFGETVQYMLPTVKQFPKLEPRFCNGIWLGKDTTTGESVIGIYNNIVRARTIRRQIMPDKYNQQLLDCVHAGPWKISTAYTNSHHTSDNASSSQSTYITERCSTTSTASEGKRQSTAQSSDQQPKQKRTAEPTSPMATSPTHQKRPALPDSQNHCKSRARKGVPLSRKKAHLNRPNRDIGEGASNIMGTFLGWPSRWTPKGRLRIVWGPLSFLMPQVANRIPLGQSISLEQVFRFQGSLCKSKALLHVHFHFCLTPFFGEATIALAKKRMGSCQGFQIPFATTDLYTEKQRVPKPKDVECLPSYVWSLTSNHVWWAFVPFTFQMSQIPELMTWRLPLTSFQVICIGASLAKRAFTTMKACSSEGLDIPPGREVGEVPIPCLSPKREKEARMQFQE